MRAINKKIVLLYAMIIAYVAVRVLSVGIPGLAISNKLNVVIWFVIFVIGYLLTRSDYNRYLQQYDKSQTAFIVVIVYLMLYFLLGLFLGYKYNAYSMTLRGLFSNTLLFLPIIVFQEYIRQVFTSYSGGKKFWLVLITILFIMISINFNSLSNDFRNAEAGFKFVCSDILPLIASNFVFTYIAYTSSCKPNIVYRLLITAASIYLPILPNVNWFYTGLFGIVVPIILYILISFSQIKLERKLSWQDEKRARPITYVPTFILLVLIIGFVVGFFKYQPVAVVSDSMVPIFSRGDVIIVEKLTQEDVENLQIGDIVKFQSDGYYVIHRIYDIEKNDEGIVFTTKGDNNNAPDAKKVKQTDVVGRYKFYIKYVGFPSVWLSEFLR